MKLADYESALAEGVKSGLIAEEDKEKLEVVDGRIQIKPLPVEEDKDGNPLPQKEREDLPDWLKHFHGIRIEAGDEEDPDTE